MQIDLDYIKQDADRHGNRRVYVRVNGRKIRIRERPGTAAFMLAYNAAVDALAQPHEHARINGRSIAPGSMAALAAKYFGSKEFLKLQVRSQNNRRGIIEECLREKTTDTASARQVGDMPARLFNASHMKWLMDQKDDLPGAAYNRRKYFSAMLGWAVQESPPLVSRNAARDVRVTKNKTAGFYTWVDDDVADYETWHAIGGKARLALALMVYTGLRGQDAIRVGPPMLRKIDGQPVIEIVIKKTEESQPETVTKPVLPELAEIIAATATVGLQTYLVNDYGNAFTEAGFRNWFKERCLEAGLNRCTAHGLRKAAAVRCADGGASVTDMMRLFDWSSPAMAVRYVQAADKKRATARTIQHLVRRPNQEQNR